MPSDYIPFNDEEAVAWIEQFLSAANAIAEQFGVALETLTAIAEAKDEYAQFLREAQEALVAYRAAVAARRAARQRALALLRPVAQQMNHHPAMTNDLRVLLGLRPRKRTRTRRSVGAEVPGVRLEVDVGRVIIHFGTNPEDERRNGKPEWAIGANIYIRAEGETDYRLLAFDTASPYVWEYRGAPQRFYFRVAYRGRGERDEGTWSDEVGVVVG